jgi:hypothetical protein
MSLVTGGPSPQMSTMDAMTVPARALLGTAGADVVVGTADEAGWAAAVTRSP